MRDALVLTRERGWEGIADRRKKICRGTWEYSVQASWEYLGKTVNKANTGEVGRHSPTVLARP